MTFLFLILELGKQNLIFIAIFLQVVLYYFAEWRSRLNAGYV